MKVLMIGWELPPHNSGGLGVACFDLCKALAHKGVELEFILPYRHHSPVDFMKISSPSNKTIVEIEALGLSYDSYRYIYNDGHEEIKDMFDMVRFYEQAVADMVDEMTFDIVHAHDWLTFRAALRVKQKRNIPIILHVHSIESDRAGGNIGNSLVREIEQQSFMLADRIIAVSQFTKKTIVKDYGIDPSKIEVVHNSIDTSGFDNLDDFNSYSYLELLKKNGYRVVSSIGRLTIQKGLTNLLYAAKAVIDNQPKTIFIIAGSGDQYYELIRLSADLGISGNVFFVGFQRGKKWRDAFSIADLFVMPSISEPFGLTPLEAAYYNTPSLITKQSGVAEVLKNCLIVDFWDINEMANKIVSFLKNEPIQTVMNEQLAYELDRLSWDDSAEKIIEIYQNHLRSEVVLS